MATRRLAVSVPEPLLDALYAEGSRTCESPGEVAARVLREALPGYVEQALHRDLAPIVRGRVVDVRPAPKDVHELPLNAEGPAVEPPALHERSPLNADASVPGDGPEPEPGSGGPPA